MKRGRMKKEKQGRKGSQVKFYEDARGQDGRMDAKVIGWHP